MARILVVNAGSSSLKLSLIGDGDETLGTRQLSAAPSSDELGAALAELGEADAVGHRVVHGGVRFRDAVLIDAEAETQLRALTELAPLHQPKSLAALDAVSQALPGVPAVACFDTAFHATLPPAARTYALPSAWRKRWGLRRYGFHGLSHAWVARRAPEMIGRPSQELRIVSCHLGAGASLCAIAGGRSIDTTMGFTPLEGLVMATRSGSVDPGLLLWLLGRGTLSEPDLAHALEHESGLLGLAGTDDMRDLLGRDDEDARLALDVYIHRLRSGIAAMAGSLGGIDALAFTGGVGENAPEIRDRAVAGLGFLRLDSDRILVIPAREDLEVARQVRALLGARR